MPVSFARARPQISAAFSRLRGTAGPCDEAAAATFFRWPRSRLILGWRRRPVQCFFLQPKPLRGWRNRRNGRRGGRAAIGRPDLHLPDQRRQLVQFLELTQPHQGQFRQNSALGAIAQPGEGLIEDLHGRQHGLQAQPLSGLGHQLTVDAGGIEERLGWAAGRGRHASRK